MHIQFKRRMHIAKREEALSSAISDATCKEGFACARLARPTEHADHVDDLLCLERMILLLIMAAPARVHPATALPHNLAPAHRNPTTLEGVQAIVLARGRLGLEGLPTIRSARSWFLLRTCMTIKTRFGSSNRQRSCLQREFCICSRTDAAD